MRSSFPVPVVLTLSNVFAATRHPTRFYAYTPISKAHLTVSMGHTHATALFPQRFPTRKTPPRIPLTRNPSPRTLRRRLPPRLRSTIIFVREVDVRVHGQIRSEIRDLINEERGRSSQYPGEAIDEPHPDRLDNGGYISRRLFFIELNEFCRERLPASKIGVIWICDVVLLDCARDSRAFSRFLRPRFDEFSFKTSNGLFLEIWFDTVDLSGVWFEIFFFKKKFEDDQLFCWIWISSERFLILSRNSYNEPFEFGWDF